MNTSTNPNETELVTKADFEAGGKSLTVVYRWGEQAEVRLNAPKWAQVQQIAARVVTEKLDINGHSEAVVEACVGSDLGKGFLDKLTPRSAGTVERVALVLAFGLQLERKTS
jgi:hypothetical protein